MRIKAYYISKDGHKLEVFLKASSKQNAEKEANDYVNSNCDYCSYGYRLLRIEYFE